MKNKIIVQNIEVSMKKVGLNSFTLSTKQWQKENQDLKVNMRDYADVYQQMNILLSDKNLKQLQGKS